ncbi:MAG: LytR/AlgR family response regulator transcription factor [Terrimicrobiaceae bacterium]|jgi:DNA-binding LytR/AlgR family response regulator
MKKILIVEDEAVALEDLRESLSEIASDLEITGVRTATEALEVLGREAFDAIFLDIELPGMSGIQLLERLHPPLPPVVLVTAHALLALDAFGLGVVECLLKPVDQQRLRKAVRRIESKFSGAVQPTFVEQIGTFDPEARVFAREGGKTWLVRVADISQIEEEERNARLFFRGENGALVQPLEEFALHLDPRVFVRAGPTTILNLALVDHFRHNEHGHVVACYSDGSEFEFDPSSSREFEDSHGL